MAWKVDLEVNFDTVGLPVFLNVTQITGCPRLAFVVDALQG